MAEENPSALVANLKEDTCEAAPLKPCHDDGAGKGRTRSWLSWRLIGPGLLACLADTDAGCLMVAAQSGARWSYSLVLMQVLLIPVLFCAQELTVRLGVYTKKGHAACIKERFGNGWAWTTTVLLVLECVLAIISEMSGIASVAQLWGMQRWAATLLAALIITGVVFKFSYKQIETIGVALGLCELSFVITMFYVHPSPGEVFRGIFDNNHYHDREYLQLVAANIGAVIMPWMIYFQQSAVVARRLTTENVHEEKVHTFFASCLTQLVMIGTIVTFAAARATSLKSVQHMHEALAPILGSEVSTVVLSLAFIGGALCAAFVVSLAASWAICEAFNWEAAHALDRSPSDAPHFYGCFLIVVVLGVMVLQLGIDDVKLNIFIELMDGLLMPFAVGFLFLLASSDLLPLGIPVTGSYKAVLAVLFSICSIVSLGTGSWGLWKELTEARPLSQ